MHKYGVRIQKTEAVQLEELVSRANISSFASMLDKDASSRRCRTCLEYVSTKDKRMRPSNPLHYLDWEFVLLQLRPLSIVVADGRNSTEKVSYSTPPKPDIFWNRFVLGDDIGKGQVYIFAPIDVIAIWRIR